MSSRLSAADLFAAINELYTKFDGLCEMHAVQKIETIGDAYWCAVGLEQPAGAPKVSSLLSGVLGSGAPAHTVIC